MRVEGYESIPAWRRVGRVFAILAAAAIMLGLAACGSGSSDSSGSTTANGRTKITVIVPPVFNQAAYLAADKGLFEEQGLDATIKLGATPDSVIPQLLNNQANFAGSNGLSAVTAIDKGLPVKVVLGSLGLQRNNTAGIVVKRDGPIKSLKDLTGKSVAVLSLRSVPELATRAGITMAGGDGSKTRFVEVPLPGMYQAVSSGKVDAAYLLAPFFEDAPKDTFVALPNPAETGPLLDSPVAAWIATNDYVAKNPDVVRRFRAAMTKAYAMGNKNPDLFREMDRKHSKRSPQDIAAARYLPFSGTINTGAFDELIKIMSQFGFVENPPTASQALAPGTPTK